MNAPQRRAEREAHLAARYREVRARTEALCAPLEPEDYPIQAVPEASPPKWHLAHVTWFFETFVLRPFAPGYEAFHPRFEYLFNSYYESVGPFHPRAQRGVLARPATEAIYRYRAHVDARVLALLESGTPPAADAAARIELGLHHEEQHQELLLMDIKANFAANPLRPAYRSAFAGPCEAAPAKLEWLERDAGPVEIGHSGAGFAFDNETPRHREWLAAHRLASRPVTNGEYLEFIAAGGYREPRHWLSDGWAAVRARGWEAPLYWERIDGAWWRMTLAGMQPVDEAEPVCHVSFYEADAFARWAGRRLPTEAELERELAARPLAGNFMDEGRFEPRAAAAGDGQWFGDVWEWTRSSYSPYPGFRPLAGALGEYNGKFMANQFVLRGGSCATPRAHMRATYRNFFYPHERWPFTGIRLADDAG
ncbi:MAG: ergothioneine biosynthesis protein EgtB [Burkholderiales bacterium]|nr:ergothioneine biosynthesis protein EgtB [Burkholderiales bacterium]